MNVASIDLCKELYELSGWNDCDFTWKYGGLTWHVQAGTKPIGEDDNTPMYDLGYLLRKLTARGHTSVTGYEDERYKVGYAGDILDGKGDFVRAVSATPEDAAAMVATELFKQGILQREASS